MTDQIVAVNTVTEASDRFYETLVDVIEHNLSLHDINDDIYRVDVEHSTGKSLYQHYLELFPEEERQQYRCKTCERWLNKYGQYVTIVDGLVKSMAFNVDVEAEGEPTNNVYAFVSALNKVISKCPVANIVVENVADYSFPHSGKFRHFNGTLNCASKELIFVYQNDEERLGKEAEARELVRILQSGLLRWGTDTVRAAYELFEYGELKHLTKFKNQFMKWHKLYTAFHETKNNNIKTNLVWEAMDFDNKDIIHFHTTAVGVLLDDIKDGNLRYGINQFRIRTEGVNYMRATEAPTEEQLEKAKKLVAELGIESAFRRRFATLADIQEWFWQPKETEAATEAKGSIFDGLKTKENKTEPQRSVVSGGDISLMQFIAEVLPKAKALFVELRGGHYGRYNFAQFTAQADPDAKPIYRWDSEEKRNSVASYSYQNGSPIGQWSETVGQRVKVVGISLTPAVWGGKETFSYQTPDRGMLLVLEGWKDNVAKQSALFAEDLSHELRDVRRVVEAFSQANPLEQVEGQVVAGLQIPGNTGVEIYRSTGEFQLLAENEDGVMVRYSLTRHF